MQGHGPECTAARRGAIPRPPTLDPLDPGEIAGVGVLAEHPPERALPLWRAARDVVLWAEVPGTRRGGLFDAEAGSRRLAALGAEALPEPLRLLLLALATVAAAPERAEPAEVAWLCGEIARWAGSGAPATRLAFAHAAAVASPASAEAALEVGRCALALGRLPAAESWLRRAIMVASRTGRVPVAADALVALGDLDAAGGDVAAAARRYRSALRRCPDERSSAAVLERLLHLAVRAGDDARARRIGRRVLRLRPGNGATGGRVSGLLDALDARRAAEAGDGIRYARSWDLAWRRLGGDASAGPGEPAATLLAAAAALRGDWDRMGTLMRRPPGPAR